MGPFEIAALAIIGGISLSAFKIYHGNKNNADSRELDELKTEQERIKQRLATLESIVTDKSYQLKDQINRL
ncbi:hypothetical protein ORJ00_17680 [Rheinheimera baltica]|uniref:hypothetical protein n=1 Tax=Rheinheimera baltica TaxID=67576 RepID=UPI00273FDA25|nr:hypothetical protein [Rheinheimera baltica]MDP5144580.1 hypothetical protein [Rheinheimera baltica]MDP5149294.1 hypothetical protein [Rheinheimera baltica]